MTHIVVHSYWNEMFYEHNYYLLLYSCLITGSELYGGNKHNI